AAEEAQAQQVQEDDLAQPAAFGPDLDAQDAQARDGGQQAAGGEQDDAGAPLGQGGRGGQDEPTEQRGGPDEGGARRGAALPPNQVELPDDQEAADEDEDGRPGERGPPAPGDGDRRVDDR